MVSLMHAPEPAHRYHLCSGIKLKESRCSPTFFTRICASVHTMFMLSTLAVCLTLVGTSFAQDCARNYTVIPGDFCDGISAAQNVSTYQLKHVNIEINSDCTNLFAEQVLCLGLEGEDCTEIHVVESGDTCFDIAVNAGTDLVTLFANNGNVNTDCSNIYPGEVLCIADEVIPYAE